MRVRAPGPEHVPDLSLSPEGTVESNTCRCAGDGTHFILCTSSLGMEIAKMENGTLENGTVRNHALQNTGTCVFCGASSYPVS